MNEGHSFSRSVAVIATAMIYMCICLFMFSVLGALGLFAILILILPIMFILLCIVDPICRLVINACRSIASEPHSVLMFLLCSACLFAWFAVIIICIG